MAVFFFDTSALVKRYVSEIGSAWVESIVDSASSNEVYIARLTEHEFTSAVTRRSRGGSLTQSAANSVLVQFRHDCANEYEILELTSALLAAAITLIETHALRANDAIQLAAVMTLNTARAALSLPPATLISSDQELNAAAQAEGVTAGAPNAHP